MEGIMPKFHVSYEVKLDGIWTPRQEFLYATSELAAVFAAGEAWRGSNLTYSSIIAYRPVRRISVSWVDEEPPVSPARDAVPDIDPLTLPTEFFDALRDHHKITAIKILRKLTGLSLVAAKNYVDSMTLLDSGAHCPRHGDSIINSPCIGCNGGVF